MLCTSGYFTVYDVTFAHNGQIWANVASQRAQHGFDTASSYTQANSPGASTGPVVQFVMYFRSEFLEIWKTIHFWKR